MKCQQCRKREATVFISQTIQDETHQMHLCEYCAKEQGWVSGIPPGLTDPMAALGAFFSSFLQSVGMVSEKMQPQIAGKPLAWDTPEIQQCPSCGYQWETFQRTGRLGCPSCYETFRDPLRMLLSGLHGHDTHFVVEEEKLRKSGDLEESSPLGQLRRELEKAIREERFEDAAKIRDQIRAHQKSLSGE